MRKGQIEIIGLMVIVILIVFVALIYIRIKGSSADQPDIIGATRENLKAANFLNALMRLSISDTCTDQLSDAAEKCIEDELSTLCGVNTCAFVKKSAEDMAKGLLDSGECYELGIWKIKPDPNASPAVLKNSANVWAEKLSVGVGKCAGCENPKQVNDYQIPGMYARLRLWKSCGSS